MLKFFGHKLSSDSVSLSEGKIATTSERRERSSIVYGAGSVLCKVHTRRGIDSKTS